MILFIFEGDEREPHLYRTMERLYFPKKNDNIICNIKLIPYLHIRIYEIKALPPIGH